MLIALGVSGGIAAYKSCEIARGLDRAGVSVQAILTKNATQFITPLTLQTLTRNPVLCDQFELTTDDRIPHIDLTGRISALVVAPATANLIAKFAHGIADDLLSTFILAVTVPIIVVPSMNSRMWLNPSTQQNLASLRSRGVQVIDPDHGWLAEQETGPGRLPEPALIVAETLAAARRSTQLKHRRVLVTAGPTREAIDPVRYVSNRSSGKMGFALATAAARRGAEVTLVSGPVDLATPYGVVRESVETAEQMREAVLRLRDGAAAVFMAAAVSDYLPKAASTKIKKTGGSLQLELDEGPDILAELGRNRTEEILVGFAAETETVLANAREKLQRKQLDFIVANDVSAPGIGFDSSMNEVDIISREGDVVHVPQASKSEVADRILDRVFGVVEREAAGA
jgi:phosphopantothenoylcysteine decarboxylase/phosphopantothenate--cysteine ligase